MQFGLNGNLTQRSKFIRLSLLSIVQGTLDCYERVPAGPRGTLTSSRVRVDLSFKQHRSVRYVLFD
jgi:hypothetical protein